MYLIFAIFALINLLIPSFSFAATQGTLGTTSTGTVGVSITIPALVQISSLSDIALGTPSSYPATGNTTACIYSNLVSPAGGYYVTATSLNASAGAFRVVNSGNFITYSAYWNNTSAATQTTALTSGTKTAVQTGGSATSVTCGGTPNANFNVSFSATQIQAASPASYTDTVTVLITPS